MFLMKQLNSKTEYIIERCIFSTATRRQACKLPCGHDCEGATVVITFGIIQPRNLDLQTASRQRHAGSKRVEPVQSRTQMLEPVLGNRTMRASGGPGRRSAWTRRRSRSCAGPRRSHTSPPSGPASCCRKLRPSPLQRQSRRCNVSGMHGKPPRFASIRLNGEHRMRPAHKRALSMHLVNLGSLADLWGGRSSRVGNTCCR